MKLSTLKKRTSDIEQGVWVNNLTHDGLSLKTRGQNNVDWRKMADKLWAEVTVEQRSDPEVRERILSQCILDAGLQDWNFTDDAGEPVPYSRDLAASLLEDHFIFRQAAVEAVTSVQFQLLQASETDSKN